MAEYPLSRADRFFSHMASHPESYNPLDGNQQVEYDASVGALEEKREGFTRIRVNDLEQLATDGSIAINHGYCAGLQRQKI